MLSLNLVSKVPRVVPLYSVANLAEAFIASEYSQRSQVNVLGARGLRLLISGAFRVSVFTE
jgi:hypothetical protein